MTPDSRTPTPGSSPGRAQGKSGSLGTVPEAAECRKGPSNRPLAVDVAAREVREQLELAAARGDAPLALSAAERFASFGLLAVAPDFAMGASSPRASEVASATAFSRPFPAKYPGRCVACDGTIAQGETAVYRAADRAVAHPACRGAAR